MDSQLSTQTSPGATGNTPPAQPSSPPASAGSQCYDVKFADGKGSTVLDMNGTAHEKLVESITSNFHKGYVVSVTRRQARP